MTDVISSIEVPRETVYLPRFTLRGGVMRVRYSDYLMCPYWKATRRQALIRAGYRCAECGWQGTKENYGRRYLAVHHLSYERLGKEIPGDLQVLCNECHSRTHGFKVISAGLGDGLFTLGEIIQAMYGEAA